MSKKNSTTFKFPVTNFGYLEYSILKSILKLQNIIKVNYLYNISNINRRNNLEKISIKNI